MRDLSAISISKVPAAMPRGYLYLRRGWLLILLGPLMLGAGCLVYHVPLDPTRTISFDEASRVVLSQRYSGSWRLDLETGEWQDLPKTAQQPVRDPTEPIWLKCLDDPYYEGRLSHWRADLLVAGSVERSIMEFSFPTRPSPLGEHFVIGQSPSAWQLLDLRDTESQIQELVPVGSIQPFVVPGSDHFFVLDDSTTSWRLILNEVLPGARTRQVGAWPIGTLGADCSLDGIIRTFSPDRSTIESRRVIDGSLVAKQPVPVGVDTQATSSSTHEGFLIEERVDAGGHEYQRLFILETGQQLNVPKLNMTEARRLEEQGLWMFIGYAADSRYHAFVFDENRGQIVFRTSVGYGCRGSFLDENRVAVASKNNGVTVHVIDLQTHKVITVYRPWWWVSPLLIACSIGFAMWALAWVRTGVPHSRWTWIDVALFAALVIVPLLLRIEAVGSRFDVNRLVFAYTQGIILALTHLCGVWIVFGNKTRWLIRTVPMVFVLSVLSILLCHVFVVPNARSFFFHPPTLAWEGLATTAIPTGLSVLAFTALRLAKFRLLIKSSEQNELDKRTSQLPLRDIFLAVTCASLLLAAAKPLLPHFPRDVPRIPWDLVAVVALAVVTHSAAVILAFANDRRWVRLGTLLMACLILSQIAIPVSHFVEPVSLSALTVRWGKFFIVSSVSLVWFYAFLLTFRHRNQVVWSRVG